MSFTLSSRDLVRYEETLETLLSPTAYPDVSSWCTAVLRKVEALFSADRSMLMLPAGGELQAHSPSIPEAGLQALRAVVVEMGPASFRADRPDVDAVMRARRAVRMDVWHNDALVRQAGLDLRSIPFYHEVMVPVGVAHGSGMVAPLPLGEAWLSLAHSRPGDDRLGVDDGTELLRMLLPAFRSGVQTLVRLEEGRSAFCDTLESLGQLLVLYDLEGRELYRSQGLEQVLSRDPERERVLSEIAAVALTLVGLRGKRRKGCGEERRAVGSRGMTTTAAAYQLRAAFVDPGLIHRDHAVVVTVERSASLPSAESLRVRYGLTAKEAEVALLLAGGASDMQIADRLAISPNTVRTHTEKVYRKLGIHSRKALGLRLLSERHPTS